MQYIKYIIFVIVGAALIISGIIYNNKLDKESALKLEAEQTAQINQQKQIMDNFKIEDVITGTGAEAKTGNSVTVNYVGTLADGTKFDSSYDRNQTFEFNLGAGDVIKGWDLGVEGMKVGGKRNLTIPPELGYGARAVGSIPANSTLYFTVELVGVK